MTKTDRTTTDRLTRILLAGTLVPAMVLIPVMPASAQAPDQNDRPHGQHQQGGGGDRIPRGGPGGGPGQGGHPQGLGQGHPQGMGQGHPQGMGQGHPQGMGQEGHPQIMQGQGRPSMQGANPQSATPERRQGGGGMHRDAQTMTPQTPKVAPKAARADDRSGIHPQGAGSQKANPQTDRAQIREDRKRERANAGRTDDPTTPRRVGADDKRQDSSRQDSSRKDLPRKDLPRNDAVRSNDPGAPRRVGNDDRRDNTPRNDRRVSPGVAVGVGVGAGIAAGLAGGFLAPTGARRIDDLRGDRREVRDGDRTFIREPGRTIVQERGRAFIVHDENARFRDLGLNVRRERRGNQFIDTIDRPGGEQILTFTDVTGRLLRRVRRTRDGREFVLIDNGDAGRIPRYADDVIVLPPPPLRIPRDRYDLDYRGADAGLIYDTLIAPPLAPPPRRYTLDQIRYSPDVRGYVRSVDINTINFDAGSWDVPAVATGQLEALGTAIKRAVARDPNSVFLIEGFTDATGNADDNLSLSDRRAQSVAEILTKSFAVPPENLTTQGYGEQNLKENTQGPSAVNRRVVVQNITQLLATGDQPPAEQ